VKIMNDNTKLTSGEETPEKDSSQGDEAFDLIEILKELRRHWKLIIGFVSCGIGLALVYCFLSPPEYGAETLLSMAQEDQAALSSATGQFSGLASIAGISMPGDSNSEKVIASLKSRQFLKRFITNDNLLPILYDELWDEENEEWITDDNGSVPSASSAVSVLAGALEVQQGKSSILVRVSIKWDKPGVAVDMVNDLVGALNDELRRKAIDGSRKRIGYLEKELAKTSLKDMRAILYNLLESEKQKAMLANVNEDFALEVIDPADIESMDKPTARATVPLGVVCSLLLGVFTVYLRQFFRRLADASVR